MHLIEYIDFEIIPTEEAMLIKPIRDLYHADDSQTKETFMQQCAIMYFLVDPRSSYAYILDEDERLQTILKEQGLPSDFDISTIATALEAYKRHTVTQSALLIEDTRVAINKVRQFLRDVDLQEEDDKGKPKYTVQSITAAIKQVPILAKDLADAEKLIVKEVEEFGRARGNQGQKSLMDDGLLR